MKSWAIIRGKMSPESQARMDARLQEALASKPEMLQTPEFENEQEEAEWWDSSRRQSRDPEGLPRRPA